MTPVVYTNVVLHINVKVLHSLPCPRCACSPPGCECLETGEGRGSLYQHKGEGQQWCVSSYSARGREHFVLRLCARPPPPPPPPLGYMTRTRSHALKKNNLWRNRRTRHHNNMTQMHRALLNSLHVSARRKRGAATAAAEEAPPLPQKCLQLCCRRSGRVAAETTLIWPRPQFQPDFCSWKSGGSAGAKWGGVPAWGDRGKRARSPCTVLFCDAENRTYCYVISVQLA